MSTAPRSGRSRANGRRHMARPIRSSRSRALARTLPLLIGIGGLALVATWAFLGRPAGQATPLPNGSMPVAFASAVPAPTATANPSNGTASSALPTSRPTASPSVPPTPDATPTPTPAPTPDPNGAPRRAADFDLVGQAIDIAFPLAPDARYRYRDNFHEWRPGPPAGYNHARVGRRGHMFRLHDGIDIYAAEGESVRAPFSGEVVDPATRWQPWVPDRYGLTVVIVSDEPGTLDYAAVLVHLDSVRVSVGDRVSRGEEVGVLGGTGNAGGVEPHLHFELRAPFLLDWKPIGEDRRVDAFNPYRSLVEADPKR